MPSNARATTSRALARYLPDKFGACPVELQRRTLLAAAAGGLGLTLGGPVLTAAASVVSLLESDGTAADTLDAAEAAIYRVGLGHMRPDTHPDHMMAAAAGVLRDVHALRQGAAPAVAARALYLESLAAATMGSIYGHAHNWPLAKPLFATARASGEKAAALREIRAPGALMVASALESKVVLYMHPTEVRGALAMAQVAAAAATHPSLGQCPPGSALAVSLVARAQAARGNHRAARVCLDEAAAMLEAPGYFAAPFLDASTPVDGPMSMFGYGTRAHQFASAEVHAAAGENDATATAITAYLADGKPASNTSAAVVRLLKPRALMNAGRLGEGAELAHKIIVELPVDHRNPMVIGRGHDLVELAQRILGAEHLVPGPLDRFAAYMSRVTTSTASAAV